MTRRRKEILYLLVNCLVAIATMLSFFYDLIFTEHFISWRTVILFVIEVGMAHYAFIYEINKIEEQ